MKRLYTLIFLCFLFTSFGLRDLKYRIIRNENFKIEFYVSTEKENSFKTDKQYFWYKSGEIHSSFGDSGGDLLEGKYTKYYKTNQLAEKGIFDNGLKDGEWKKWHQNGQIKRRVKWRGGKKTGYYRLYDENGKPLLVGKYRNNLKQGKWIDYRISDTLKYKKGKLIVKDTLKKDSFIKNLWKKIFKKKEIDTLKVSKHEIQKDSTEKVPFFRRIFGKKKIQEDHVEN